jgi:hypothetical protein
MDAIKKKMQAMKVEKGGELCPPQLSCISTSYISECIKRYLFSGGGEGVLA